jgi:hypothetical protein
MKQRIISNRYMAIALSLLLATMSGYAQEENKEFKPFSGQAGKDVVWVPTPQSLVDTMLSMANVTSADVVMDLGSGDGRLVITAAKRGAKALGIEYNPDMVALARRTAMEEGVSESATFEQADIFETDFSKATVITLFLLSDLNLRLRPTILDMKPGTRIVSNTFTMSDWEPDMTKQIPDNVSWRTALLWIVPAKVDGTWKFNGGQVHFNQQFQFVTGTLTMGSNERAFTGKLNGDKIHINVGGTEFTGTVSGNRITGTSADGTAWNVTR